MRRPSTLLSLTIAASILCSPVVLPETARADGPADSADDPVLDEAKSLYKEGQNKFQTADYEEALALWKRAFVILPEGDEHRSIRHALVYNIAEAHSRAYEISRNPTHLRKAKLLLEDYRTDHRALFGDAPDALKERSEVEDRIAGLDKRIAESVEAGETSTPLTDDGVPGGTPAADGVPATTPPPSSKPLTPQQQWEADIKADPQLGPKWEKGNKRLVGGAILAGIGGIFAIVTVGIFVSSAREDVLFRRLYYVGGVATGVIAVGTLIPGGVLLGTGIASRRQVLEARPKPVGNFVPMLNPGGGGVGFVGRF